MPLIKHFTNAEHLSSIYADGVLKLEGSNIEYMIRNNIEAIHPSGLPVNTLWKVMKMQYKLAGRYVWLTEETDVNCITAQRKFEKIAFVFDVWSLGSIILEVLSGFPLWLSLKSRVKSLDGRSIINYGIFGVSGRDNAKILTKQN